jgi:hypothetical protein
MTQFLREDTMTKKTDNAISLPEEEEATAHLQAAAPVLLTALKHAARQIVDLGCTCVSASFEAGAQQVHDKTCAGKKSAMRYYRVIARAQGKGGMIKQALLTCALVLLLAGTAHATPFTVSLAGSDCLWCLDGALTLDQTSDGFIFTGPQAVTTDYLGEDAGAPASLFQTMSYACDLCANGSSSPGWGIGISHDLLTSTFIASVTTLTPDRYSLALTEFRLPVREDGQEIWYVQRAWLTNTSHTGTVPESPTWLLLALGLAGLGWKYGRLVRGA